jgi:hypothetical protein
MRIRRRVGNSTLQGVICGYVLYLQEICSDFRGPSGTTSYLGCIPLLHSHPGRTQACAIRLLGYENACRRVGRPKRLR